MASKMTEEDSGTANSLPAVLPRKRPERAAKRAAVERLTAPPAPPVVEPPHPPPPEPNSLPDLRNRLAALQNKHESLRKFVCSKGDVAMVDRLHMEFEAAAGRFTESSLAPEGDSTEGPEGGRLIDLDSATGGEEFVERIHEMVAKRKAAEGEDPPLFDAYRFNGKTVFPLERNRAGICFVPTFEGKSCEPFYVVLIHDRSHRGRVRVSESTLPHFVSLREAEREHLTRNAQVLQFLDLAERTVQAFVARREQVRYIQRECTERIKEVFHTQSFSSVEFVLEEHKRHTLPALATNIIPSKLGVSLTYEEPTAQLPAHVAVITWGDSSDAAAAIATAGRKSFGSSTSARLRKAEDILRKKPLNQAYHDIVSLFSPAARIVVPPVPLPSRSRRVRERGERSQLAALGETSEAAVPAGDEVDNEQPDMSNALVLFEPTVVTAEVVALPTGDDATVANEDVPAGSLTMVLVTGPPDALPPPAGASARALRAERTAAARAAAARAKARSAALNATKRAKAAEKRGAARLALVAKENEEETASPNDASQASG